MPSYLELCILSHIFIDEWQLSSERTYRKIYSLHSKFFGKLQVGVSDMGFMAHQHKRPFMPTMVIEEYVQYA